jgi:hypothetical protein
MLFFFVNFVKEINKTMRKTRYSDVVSKAEVLANDPNSYIKRGALKSKIARRLSRLTTRAVFLTQFEELETVNF